MVDAKAIVLAIVIFIILRISGFANGSEQAVRQTLDTMFSNYEKAVRPYYGEKPVYVGISAYVLSVSELSMKNMDLTLTMYLRQKWDDPRLGFRNSQRGLSYSPLARNITTINLDESRSKTIWKPDTFVANEKKSHKHDITTANEFYRISQNGTVLRSTRYTMTLICPMNLQFYPFDRQTCSAEIESFAATMQDITFYWSVGKDSLGVSAETSLPEFRLAGYDTETIELSLSTGNYSRLIMHLTFERSFGYHLCKFYFPMFALVIASGLCLIFATPTMGPLIQILTIIFLIFHAEISWVSELPKISYITSLHIYFVGCIAHLILALLVSLGDAFQYARRMSSMNGYCNICKPLSELDNYRGTTNSRRSVQSSSSCNGRMIMFCCFKWIIVILFVVFNVLYWSYYQWATAVANKHYKNGMRRPSPALLDYYNSLEETGLKENG